MIHYSTGKSSPLVPPRERVPRHQCGETEAAGWDADMVRSGARRQRDSWSNGSYFHQIVVRESPEKNSEQIQKS